MKQRKAKHRDKHFNTPKDDSSGLLSRRKYSVMATICEVFLRRGMGVRYFNGRVFAGTVFGLCFHRMVLWSLGKHDDIPTESMWGYYYFDWFIGLFILLSFGHFIWQWRDQAKGIKHYSHSMGDSRLFFIARGLGIRRYIYLTYVVTEPLAIVLLAPLVLFYSPYLAIITLLAAFWLCWDNLKSVAHEQQLFLDRQDSEIYAGHVMQSMKESDATNPDLSRPAGAAIAARKPIKPKPAASSPSLQNILKNLSPELRSLGQDKDSEDSIS